MKIFLNDPTDPTSGKALGVYEYANVKIEFPISFTYIKFIVQETCPVTFYNVSGETLYHADLDSGWFYHHFDDGHCRYFQFGPKLNGGGASIDNITVSTRPIDN